MKILRITWRNFRGLADGEIDAQGNNVTISGRNGAGKSSIGSVVTFVLFGGNGKSFDDRGLIISERVPDATVEFDTAKFRRMVTPANKNRVFVDDKEVSVTAFNQRVYELTNRSGDLLFNPFRFPNLDWKSQRDYLLDYFTVADEPPSDIIVDAGDVERLRSLKKQAAGIPFQIEEISRQISDEKPRDDLSADDFSVEDEPAFLEASIKAKREELDKIRPQDFTRDEKHLRDRIAEGERRRQELLSEYRTVKTSCPTCGQDLPASKIQAVRASIIIQGKRVAAWIEKYRDELETLESKIKLTLNDGLRAKVLQQEIRDLEKRLDAALRNDKLKARLAELRKQEKSLNAQIVELEGKIATAQKLRQDRLINFESQINRQFEHVKFKLFRVQANGDIKPDCTAMLDGVPFDSLSKGEKLKAALDIFRTLQRKFNVEMPLLIDDAESYTANSFVSLTNQLFLFKVADCDLTIEIHTARAAA